MLLALALACHEDPPPAPPSAVATAPVAVAPTAAPTTEVYGLKLGQSTAAEIEAWLAARSLVCPPEPSARRTTVRYACAGPIPAAVLPDRVVKGELHELLLVRGDDLPLRHLSSQRRYSLPEDALTDYAAALASLTAVLGEPARLTPTPTVPEVSGKLAHFASAWLYTDLEVRLTILRANGPTINVSETWDQPGVEHGDRTREHPRAAEGPPPGSPAVVRPPPAPASTP